LGDSWTVALKYDDSRFYRERAERLKGELEERSNNMTKTVPQAPKMVDAIGLHQKDGVQFLEAKDFLLIAAGKHEVRDVMKHG
jgi:hypothetical protein